MKHGLLEDKDLRNGISRKDSLMEGGDGGQQTMDEGYISEEGVMESKDGGRE